MNNDKSSIYVAIFSHIVNVHQYICVNIKFDY